jgi:hypothetical protein
MDQKNYIEKLQDQINQIIGASSTLKRRKKTNEDTQKEIFINTIPLLEHIINRGSMLFADYGIDLAKHDEPFFQIIDSLIYLHFGKEAGELIMFYIYERTNPDGTINPLIDDDDKIVPLDRIEDLWELVKQIRNNARS